MVQGPPSSDSEDLDDVREYQYESEGEERLGTSARTLLRESRGDYRCKLVPRSHVSNVSLLSSGTGCIAGIYEVTFLPLLRVISLNLLV